MSLNVNIHVSGWISDPRATIFYKPAPATNKTVKFVIVDNYFNVLSDEYTTTYNAGLEYKTYNLGDWINSQRQIKNINPGAYLLVMKIVEDDIVSVAQLFLSNIAISIPSDQESDYLEHIAVIDRVTGSLLKLPKSINLIMLDSRYIVYLYYHKGNKGRLVKLNETGGIEFDSGYHRFGKVEIRLKFNSLKDLAIYMFQRAYFIDEKLVKQVVDYLETGNITDALKILKVYYRAYATGLGRTVINIDTLNNELRETTYVYLGQIDWQKIIGVGIGCGLGVAGAIILTGITAGLGAVSIPLVAKACLAGGVVTAIAYVVTSSDSKAEIIKDAERSASEGKNQITDEVTQLTELLNRLKDEGKITQDDYNRIIESVNKIKEVSFRVIDELVEDVKKAYDEGYRNALEKSKWWIIGAGAGGLVLGLTIKR